MTSLRDFRLASIAYLDAAETLLASDSKKPAAKHPVCVGYLASVALECLLKARLLFRGGFESDEKLAEKQPDVYRALFKGATGHDVRKLAEHLRLSELLRIEGKELQEDAIWKRLTHSARPYSLRYGTEELSNSDAAAEVARVKEVQGPLLTGLKISRKVKKKRTRTS